MFGSGVRCRLAEKAAAGIVFYGGCVLSGQLVFSSRSREYAMVAERLSIVVRVPAQTF